MTQKISFKQSCLTIGQGIHQFFNWVAQAFSSNNKTKFWRVTWGVFTLCFAIITSIIIMGFMRDRNRDERYASRTPLSARINFAQPYYSDGPGWIENSSTGRKLIKDVDYVVVSDDNDSLAVIFMNGKRGYINRFTGDIAIQPIYDKAWVFSEGVAAVMKDNVVHFIDSKGDEAPIKSQIYNSAVPGYVFHGKYCVSANAEGKMGLIDNTGEWAVDPVFDFIQSQPRDFWTMKINAPDGKEQWYAYNDNALPVTDESYPNVEIIDDLGIVMTLANNAEILYDFDGNKLNDFLVNSVDQITYEKAELDIDGNPMRDVAPLMRYRTSQGYEGLCTPDGKILTEPLYWTISAVSSDTYLCTFKDTGVGVLINSKGEILTY